MSQLIQDNKFITNTKMYNKLAYQAKLSLSTLPLYINLILSVINYIIFTRNVNGK